MNDAGETGSCCAVDGQSRSSGACPTCSRHGRRVNLLTLQALLCPESFGRLSGEDYRYCATPDCPVVYFGQPGSFSEADLTSPVFHKAQPGARMVCYCLGVREDQLAKEMRTEGRSPSLERIERLVREGRCACEVRNPEGSCCLGNVRKVLAAAHVPTAAAHTAPTAAD